MLLDLRTTPVSVERGATLTLNGNETVQTLALLRQCQHLGRLGARTGGLRRILRRGALANMVTAPQFVDRQVAGNREQPGGQGPHLRPVTVQLLPGAHEGVLGQILGEGRRAPHAAEKAEEGPLVAHHQRGKGLAVAGTEAGKQIRRVHG